MTRFATKAVLGATLAAAVAVIPLRLAVASTRTSAPPLCRTTEVAYYYGGSYAGLGRRAFDITLLGRDGTKCRLSDRPSITLAGPGGPTDRVPISVGGRGGMLTLTPSAPLHVTISWHVADAPSNKVEVSTLTLRMPGGGLANPEPFQYPFTSEIAKNLGGARNFVDDRHRRRPRQRRLQRATSASPT